MDEYRTTEIAVEDVQSRLPALQLSLSRVGVTAVEKVIRVRHDGREQLFSAQLECFVDLGPRQKGAHMSRFEEVVNEAIGEVILRRERVPRRDARPAHRRARARAAGRAHGRGHDQRALPGAQAGAGVGDRDAGDLHAARLGRRRPDRHAPHDRRDRHRHDRLPVRADAGPGELARAARRAGLLRRRDRARVRGGPGRHAQPARARDAADRLPGGLRRPTSTRSSWSRSSRPRCRRRSTS